MFGPKLISNGEVNLNDVVDVRLPNDGKPVQSLHGELRVYRLSPEEIEARYGPPTITKFKLIKLIGEGKSNTEIGKILGVPGEVVVSLINKYGIDVEKVREKNAEFQKNKEELYMGTKLQEMVKKLPKEQYIKLLEEGKTNAEIGRMFGIDYKSLNFLKRFYCMTPSTKGRENEDGYNIDMIPKSAGGAGWYRPKEPKKLETEIDKTEEKEIISQPETPLKAEEIVTDKEETADKNKVLEALTKTNSLLAQMCELIEDLLKEIRAFHTSYVTPAKISSHVAEIDSDSKKLAEKITEEITKGITFNINLGGR